MVNLLGEVLSGVSVRCGTLKYCNVLQKKSDGCLPKFFLDTCSHNFILSGFQHENS